MCLPSKCEALSSVLHNEKKKKKILALAIYISELPCHFGPVWELCRKEGDSLSEDRVLVTLTVESLFGCEAHVARLCGLGHKTLVVAGCGHKSALLFTKGAGQICKSE